jgi:hypothetical protein
MIQYGENIRKTTRFKGLVRVLEVWFDDEPLERSGADLIKYWQRSKPTCSRNWLYYYTLLIDIDLSPEELLSRMHSGNAQQIRRAMSKDRFECQFIPSPSDQAIESFIQFHDAVHGPGSDLQLDRAALKHIASSGLLALSKVSTQEGKVVAWHAYVCHLGQTRARCDLSVTLRPDTQDSDARNFIGRGNRLLHYRDMLALRELGIRTYDFGGWYPRSDDQKRLNINRFKEGFGGEVVREYQGEIPLTLLGKLYLGFRQFKWRLLHKEQWDEFIRRRLDPASLEEVMN